VGSLPQRSALLPALKGRVSAPGDFYERRPPRAPPGGFLLHTLRIARQLAAARGLVGYSLNAEPLAKRFWMLSVWEDDAALRAFVGRAPHAQAMRVMTPHMRPTEFVR